MNGDVLLVLHGPPEQEGLQDVAFQLHHRDDDAQQDQRRDQALGDQRDEHGHRPGEHRR